MEGNKNVASRPANPRRKKRTQLEIFKEAYLPAIIVCATLLMILIFIIGSISRGIQYRKLEQKQNEQIALEQKEEADRLSSEAESLHTQATAMAAGYDYDGAIALIDSFSGDIANFEDLTNLRQECIEAKDSLVLWEDNSQVLNLSFQLLIADPQRAFSNETYGTSYNRNFVTTDEFTKILQQLYENGYMLISMDDIAATQTAEDGTVYVTSKPLYLPAGKKPVILTQTNVNYNTYMIDGDGDMMPDKDGAGFASRLLIDDNGNLACELVHADGTVSTGAYDLVPILDAFITTHPDFSYKGAKAILAVTGYDGLFGYRTNPAVEETQGSDYRQQQITEASLVIDALRNSGYDIACYTYENIAYGGYEIADITADLNKWNDEVFPILGQTDMLVFAKNSDISNTGTMYSGDKFNTLSSYGFRYYLGFCEDGNPWQVLNDSYFRQGRLLVTGASLAYNADWFTGIFDAATVLDGARGTVPE